MDGEIRAIAIGTGQDLDLTAEHKYLGIKQGNQK